MIKFTAWDRINFLVKGARTSDDCGLGGLLNKGECGNQGSCTMTQGKLLVIPTAKNRVS